jgi:hypothetical protein
MSSRTTSAPNLRNSSSAAAPKKRPVAKPSTPTVQLELHTEPFSHPFFGFELQSRDADNEHAPIFRLSELMNFRLDSNFETLCDCALDSIELGDQMIDLRIKHVPVHIDSLLTAEISRSNHAPDLALTWILAKTPR